MKDLKRATEYLKSLDKEFWGSVIIRMKKGVVYQIIQKQSHKLEDQDGDHKRDTM